MVDILKITSAIPAASRADNLPKQLPGDAVFDINRMEAGAPRYRVAERREEGEDPREALLRNLSREIFSPLKADLSAQAEGLKKLIMFMRFFDGRAQLSGLSDIEGLFINPEELLKALLSEDRAATVFRGEFFDALRALMAAGGDGKLKEAIADLLKAFDARVNMEGTAKTLSTLTGQFASMLREEDAETVRGLLARLDALRAGLADGGAAAHRHMAAFLKRTLLPALMEMADKYRFISGGRLQGRLMDIVHNVVRFDRADTRLLEGAAERLFGELKSYGRFTDADAADLRRLLFAHLDEAVGRARLAGAARAGSDAAGAAKGSGAQAAGAGAEAAKGGAAQAAGAGAEAAKGGSAQAAGAGAEAAKGGSAGAAGAGAEAAKGGSAGAAGAGAEAAKGGSAGAAGAGAEAARGSGAQAAGAGAEAARGGGAQAAGAGAEAAKGGAEAGRPAAPGDLADVIARAIEISSTSKASAAAHSMLSQIIQNESPVFALLHFMFPVKFRGEDVYSEFYVDKDAGGRGGDGGDGDEGEQSVFFVIRSEKFGNFEVGLIAKGRSIDLDVKCPEILENDVKDIRGSLKKMAEELGYSLSAYNVGVWREGRSVLQQFPGLATRKAGIDVRV